MMQSYQFIKYNCETNVEHIKKYNETCAILCFDFEDTINSEQKQYYRNCFRNIAQNVIPSIDGVKIGVRINNDLLELAKDLDTISNLFINSIFFPKIENIEQIENILKLLNENKVSYDELIPIIETKNGLFNLDTIVEDLPPKIKRLGFGHCDYNLSIKAFPFFHQNSIEYWKWINKINSIISSKGLSIINSAYLELENYSFFQSMLHYLYEIFGDNVGQTALTSEQSKLIKQFNPINKHLPFNNLVNHRLYIGVPNHFDEQIINSFESYNKDKAFSILEKNKVMISPQEYLSAKIYYAEKKSKRINLTFVGGCFPVQANILFEDLFHQKLKRKIENKYKIELDVNIIRYERFSSCLNKIKKYNKTNSIDILVFHVRPEPFLRLVKFYYKHLNNVGKIKHSFNISFLGILNPEKYDMLMFEKKYIFSLNKKETQFHKMLIDLNYKIGAFFGNKNYSLKKYFEFAYSIVEYCNNANISPIILGIATRNNSSLAPMLCKELNSYFKNEFKNRNTLYIESFKQNSDNRELFIQSNGIYATEQYHEFIAEKLFNELKPQIEKII